MKQFLGIVLLFAGLIFAVPSGYLFYFCLSSSPPSCDIGERFVLIFPVILGTGLMLAGWKLLLTKESATDSLEKDEDNNSGDGISIFGWIFTVTCITGVYMLFTGALS